MINLLPFEDKIAIKREYQGRLYVVIGLFFASAMIVSMVFLTPTFFLLDGYKADLNHQIALSSQRAEALDTEAIISEIKELNSKVNVLKSAQENLGLSSRIEKIIKMKTKEVRIINFNYENARISMSGAAGTRQSLLNFINSLKKEFGAENMVSPISNLLNEKDANFSLTVLSVK